jgi:hypothetical protein
MCRYSLNITRDSHMLIANDAAIDDSAILMKDTVNTNVFYPRKDVFFPAGWGMPK